MAEIAIGLPNRVGFGEEGSSDWSIPVVPGLPEEAGQLQASGEAGASEIDSFFQLAGWRYRFGAVVDLLPRSDAGRLPGLSGLLSPRRGAG
jgi:hypothetical protein